METEIKPDERGGPEVLCQAKRRCSETVYRGCLSCKAHPGHTAIYSYRFRPFPPVYYYTTIEINALQKKSDFDLDSHSAYGGSAWNDVQYEIRRFSHDGAPTFD